MSDDDPKPVHLSARERRALDDLIRSQIAIDEARMFPRRSAAELDEEMHGVRHPIQDGPAVIYPIACRRNELAQRRDEEVGGCRWVKDDSGLEGSVSCTTCGKTVGPGMPRHEQLRGMVEGRYTLRRKSSMKIVGGAAISDLGLEHPASIDE